MRGRKHIDKDTRRAMARDTANARAKAEDRDYLAQLADTWSRQSGQRVRVSA